MAKEILFYGKNIEELKKLSIESFMELINSRQRRSLKRGFTPAQKSLLEKIRKHNSGMSKKQIKTHCRDMVILPEMLGLTILVHQGKEFSPVTIIEEMLGHYLGEFTQTRVKVKHSAPGIGATKSSASVSVK
ncbi:30S ribosomal protein S19 [Candidatus Woesearchaeota archaeon]|nr:30S ribosomal protein S19 [Candidatus Woesearchaeota archaeon]